MAEREKIVRYTSKPLTQGEADRLNSLADLPDESINFSDMPEAGDDFFDRAVRGPIAFGEKRQTTLQLDADLIAWFEEGGSTSAESYQARINEALREYMERHAGAGKKAS